jgi:tellurite resistance protein
MNRYTDVQITMWLKGLLAIAWADGDFSSSERGAIIELTKTELAIDLDFESLDRIDPQELASVLQPRSQTAENFLRTAMLVAVADGVYSPPEATLLQDFHRVLEIDAAVLQALNSTNIAATAPSHTPEILLPVAQWLDRLEIHDRRVARLLCKFIPAQCPFERDIVLFDRKIVHIPPLCKLNPLYDQTVGLRFRALSYLADECGEDVSPYC